MPRHGDMTCIASYLVGATCREGVSQPSLPRSEGRRAGVGSGAGSTGALWQPPASAETLTANPLALPGRGLHRLERRSSSVERRGRHLDIIEGACRQGGSVVPAHRTARVSTFP
jgi:hypothetical protein